MRNAVISRDEILEASRLMLQEKGWSAIHMRSVAVRCGVSVGSLYNYFPSKTELVAATVESVWQELFHVPEDLPEEERFCKVVQWLHDSIQEGNRRYQGFLILHAWRGQGGGSPDDGTGSGPAAGVPVPGTLGR